MNTKKNSPLKFFSPMFGQIDQTRNSINRDLNDIRNGTSPNMGVGAPRGAMGTSDTVGNFSGTGMQTSGMFSAGIGNASNLFGAVTNGGGYGGPFSGSPGGMFGNTGASVSGGSIGGNALMGAMGSIRNGESIRNRQTNSIANVKKVAANNKRLVDKGLVAPGSKPDSRAPLFQLKNNNMEYNNINNKAFSNAGTIKNIVGESVPNTFTRKVGNSPFKQAIDPMIADGIDEPIAPPNRIATATTPPYDINNY